LFEKDKHPDEEMGMDEKVGRIFYIGYVHISHGIYVLLELENGWGIIV
jgi:dynactin complex subunit